MKQRDKKPTRKNLTRYILFKEKAGSTHLSRKAVSSTQLLVGLTLFGMVISALVVVAVIGLSELRVRSRTGELIQENQLLVHQVNQVRQRLDNVQLYVDSLAQEEEDLRVRVDLPPIGEEVRQAGIGSILPIEQQVIGDERIEELLRSLDQIERELSIQEQSYQEIHSKILLDEDRLRHVPSIVPVNTGRFTDGFGYRRDPFTKRRRFHYGADFAAPRGTPVFSTADGVIIKAKQVPGFGKLVAIDHGYGYITEYGHLQDFAVRKGQKVKRGDQIGFVGNTGRSTGPHLHYEVKVNGIAVDPLDYFYEGYTLKLHDTLNP